MIPTADCSCGGIGTTGARNCQSSSAFAANATWHTLTVGPRPEDLLDVGARAEDRGRDEPAAERLLVEAHRAVDVRDPERDVVVGAGAHASPASSISAIVFRICATVSSRVISISSKT